MKKGIVWSVLVILLIGGHTLEPVILEDVQLVSIYGYDYVDKNTIKGVISSPIIPMVENTPPKNEIFAAKGHTSKNTRQKLQAESPEPLVTGRLNTLLYNKKIAKKGILSLITTMGRDPALGRATAMAIVEGEVEDLLEYEYKVTETSAQYVEELLSHNSKDVIPKTNLHSFLDHYYLRGQDPFLPLIKKEKDRIRIKGIALFYNDRYVSYIPYKECFVFKLLYENFNNGMYEFKQDGNYVTIENLFSKNKIRISDGNGSPKAHIDISIKGKITDAPRLVLTDKKVVSKIETALEQQIKRQAYGMLNQFKKKNIDPLGLGELARSQTYHFDFQRWEHHYKDLPFSVNVEVEITQTGTIE
ncbi:Ger(x)C family spore germination protein [Peribacillus sp. SCS-37]|uniref:Ger(x)C family spore germination protein n=1 Tax=Paraperibacillus esterisolvens TaxID=3115296 RepID=UPI003905FFA2